MSDIVDALDRELQRLEAELMQDVRYRRIRRIRELIDDYRADEATVVATRRTVATPAFALTAQDATKAMKMRSALRELIRQKSAPVHRSELLAHLTTEGLMGNEKNPMGALAAYLSDWRDEFSPDGRGNWSLKASPQGEAEGVGPSAN